MIALLIAGAFSMLYSLLLTPVFIRIFNRLRWGQPIRVDGPKEHEVKRGTPTMGGIIFLSGSVIAYFVGKLLMGEDPSPSALLVIFMALGAGLVGFIDDYMKTRKQNSAGLGGWAKIVGQIVIAVTFALLGLQFANENGVTPASTQISIFRDLPVDFMALGTVAGVLVFVVWVMIITTATTNAVNVTDGLDGFLWWNTNPAQVFMGDTGSMAIGGAIAALAMLTRTELLLLLIGGLFIVETGSVILQRIYFKVTKGKRIFRMSPIHHHFELKGWAENTVVVRFWFVAGLFVIVGIGAFYAEWLLQQ